MPPKKNMKGGKGKKPKRLPEETTREEAGSDLEPGDTEEDEDDCVALHRIVDFYENHPYFYDLRHEKYRNTKLKEAELADLAKEINCTVDKIKRKFKNLRTAYGKLKNRAGSAGKSGQASCRLTRRQEWKLRNLVFLDEVILPRIHGQELGRVPGEDEDDLEAREESLPPENEDEDRGAEGLQSGSSAHSQDRKMYRPTISKKKKVDKSTPDVGEILTEMLLENRKRERETEKKLEESANRQPDEREAWGIWLQTVVRNCPKEKFRQFQTETLSLSQRYQPTAHGHFMYPPQEFRGKAQPQFLHQEQQMQQPEYIRQPTCAQMQNQSTHQHHPQHQPNRTASAPIPVDTSNIIASSYQIANQDDADQDFSPAFSTPALGARQSLSSFRAGSFGFHGTSADQSVLSALKTQSSSTAESDA